MSWYDRFFDGIVMDFWRSAVPEDSTRAETLFLKEALELRAGSYVLDAPCGLGRHALALSAEGIRVRGLDISPSNVEEVNRLSKAGRLMVEADVADLADAPLGGPYDGAFCLGNSFGYFEPAAIARFCRRVAESLLPAGRFVIHTAMAAESFLPDFREREWIMAGDIACLMECGYDVERAAAEIHYTFVREGRSERRSSEHYVFTLGEIGRFLQGAGFRVLAVSASTDGTPFELGDSQAYIVAEKA